MLKYALMLIGSCLVSGALHSQVRYDIRGTYAGGEGKRIFLELFFGSMDGRTIDSADVRRDGTFVLEGELAEPGCAMVAEKDGFQSVFLDGSPLELTLHVVKAVRTGKDSVVFDVKNPTLNQLACREVTQFGMDYFLRNFSTGFMKLRMERAESEHEKDSLQGEIDRVDAENERDIEEFFERYSDTDAAPFFIEYNLLKYYSLDEVCGYYDRLSERVKQTKKGRELGERLAVMKKFAPGNPAPDFELPTPEGEMLALRDFRGHVVILDFWASWCAPCLGEMPVMKEIYEKYHAKGLEIIGISLDDKRDRWVNAIEKEGLEWKQVSSLKGRGGCPVAQLYQVIGIPKLYVIDEDGKIVANDLRGEALKEKMDELFSEYKD